MAGHRARKEVRALKKAQWQANHQTGSPSLTIPASERVVGNPGLLRLPNLVAAESALEKYGGVGTLPLVVNETGAIVAGSAAQSLAPVVVPSGVEVTFQDLLNANPAGNSQPRNQRARDAALPLLGHLERYRLLETVSLESALYAVGALAAANKVASAAAMFTLAQQKFHPENGTAWSSAEEQAIAAITAL